jgi:hypothetical protein
MMAGEEFEMPARSLSSSIERWRASPTLGEQTF